MAKVLLNRNYTSYWFERLSAISYYSEKEFELRILNQASSLFKNYYVIPFNQLISKIGDPNKTCRPDLAFIKKDYSCWYFIEVELEEHRLQHVLDQVSIMNDAQFNGFEVTQYILKKEYYIAEEPSFNFDNDKLRVLVDEVKPEVLVIVDETKTQWEDDLHKLGVKLCVIQVYKNGTGEELLRIKGQYPRIFTETIHCRFADFPKPFGIEIINHLEIFEGKEIKDEIFIDYNGKLTKWTVLRLKKSSCILRCFGSNPLPIGKDFVLKIDEDKNLYYFQLN